MGLAEEAAEARELAERLRTEVARLPGQQGEAFWLHCVEQSSYEQVGEVLDIDTGHARVLVHRARVRLKEALDVDEQPPRMKVSRT